MTMQQEKTVLDILREALDEELKRVRNAYMNCETYATQRLAAIGRCLAAFDSVTGSNPPVRPDQWEPPF